MTRKALLPLTASEYFNVRHDETTVSIRMIENPLDPEYDPRIELPISEEFVADLRKRGQLQPALGYKLVAEDGSVGVTLTAGRQRWKSIREIWRRMTEDGSDMKFAPVFKVIVAKTKSAADRREERFAENCHRTEFGGLDKAREVARQLEIVGDDERGREDVRILFGFKSPAAMDNCLALLDTTAKVQELLNAGAISPTAALQLARQEPAVQDAVADKIESPDEDDEGGDDETDSDGAQIDAFAAGDEPGNHAPESERPASSSRPKSVSEVKEMIRDATGAASYNLVTLKQIEKEMERRDKEREKLLDRFQQDPGVGEKREAALSRIARLDGYIEALRWARGESLAIDQNGSGNDKVSAAWCVLEQAIADAPWPKLQWSSEDDGPDLSGPRHELHIAGELVAIRDFYNDGAIYSLRINTDTKFFKRLLDPYGKPSQLIRDFDAHGLLARDGARLKHLHHGSGRVMIEPKRAIASRWAEGAGWIFDGIANQETMPLETEPQDDQVAEVSE